MQKRRAQMGQLACATSVAVLSLLAHTALAVCECPSDFELRYGGATTIEIAVAWQAVPAATGYIVERSSSCDFGNAATYNVSSAVTAYGDTGKQPTDKLRFGPPTPWSPSSLSSGATYTYRVRAQLADQTELISNCVDGQLATEPVRGVAGDLWADVVLGQPDFTQNDFAKTTDTATEYAGGVLIDRTHTPNRMYVGDTNHNRILGFDHVGRCSGLGAGTAVGKSYTTSLTPNSEYPDTSNSEFTDGRDGNGPTWIDTGSFGFPHWWNGALTVDADIDLGAPTTFNTASLNSGGANNHYTASSLELFSSDNGSQWTAVGQFDNPDRLFTFLVRFAPVTARYVRFRVHALSGCIDCDWLFLGEGRVGNTNDPDRICSVDADCDDDGTCLPDPGLRPQIVIGQPSFTDHAACNGDGTGQVYPARAPASAASLCLMDPIHLTPGETVYATMMAVDAEGSLYVPDLYNHRVLKYVDPFGTDQIADDIWGQEDFSGNSCNRGAGPTANTLCLADAPHAGVAIDAAGSLWVADANNARVLRFPNIGGSIAHDADVVLGQASFTTKASGSALNQMTYPLDLTVDESNGRLYVADASFGPGSRVLEFRPPFVSGMTATRALNLSLFCNFNYPQNRATSLRMDTRTHGLWVQNSCWFTELFDLSTSPPTPRTRVQVVTSDGIDVNDQGDLFVVGKWNDLHEFKRAGLGADYRINIDQILFSGNSPVSSEAMRFGYGVTVLNDQLIAADGNRMLIWNNTASLLSGQAADDVYGQPDFQAYGRLYAYAYPQAYGGQLWVNRVRDNGWHDVLVFDAPLTNASTPVTTIPLLSDAPPAYLLLGCPGHAYCNCTGASCSGAAMTVAGADMIDFAPTAGGDEIWLADRWNNRVFRIANLRGQRDAYRGPFVDIVVGQPSLASTACNHGMQSPAANTLCYPYDLAVDAAGNLYVADNGGESGSNSRILEFDASQLIVAPEAGSAKLGVLPSRVLGTGGNYTFPGFLAASDPLISPFKPGLHSSGALATGNNPYMAPRFGVVYTNPLEEQVPQFALGDLLSYPAGGMFFDERGDLYVSDTNWSRILIYRQPLALVPGASPPPTRTRTPPSTPTSTPTPVASCVGGTSIEGASLRIMRNLNPAGDEKLELHGRIQLSDTTAVIDPITDGFSFAVTSQSGTILFARTVAPREASSAYSVGWHKNGRGTRWTYKDRFGVTPGGIRQVLVTRLQKPGAFTFRVNATDSNFQVKLDQLPLHLQVVLGGTEQALAAECATFSFGPTGTLGAAPSVCNVKRAGDTINCH